MMILVDTTTWIDFFAGHSGEHVTTLKSSIKHDEDICLCGVILAEVLQGIRNDRQFEKTRRYLDRLIYLPISHAAFMKSAEIYRSLRKKGITIRRSLDCMIASVAIEHGIHLLHNDKDFDPIEKYCGLKTVKMTKRYLGGDTHETK